MATWAFPDHPFNIEDKTGTYGQCRLVAEDSDTVTFDYIAKITESRMRAQILKDNIQSISWPAPTTVETLLSTLA